MLLSIGVGGVIAVRANAAGVPDMKALTYNGYIETPDGKPVTAKVNIFVNIYDAATDGTKVCEQTVMDLTPVSGRFQVELPEACTVAVKANPNLWIEAVVNGSALGRTKLGAVPYALEAGHATSADAVGSLPASSINNGVLHTDAFSAYADLQAEGKLDNAEAEDLLTRAQIET